jgi:hypothetical protein
VVAVSDISSASQTAMLQSIQVRKIPWDFAAFASHKFWERYIVWKGCLEERDTDINAKDDLGRF